MATDDALVKYVDEMVAAYEGHKTIAVTDLDLLPLGKQEKARGLQDYSTTHWLSILIHWQHCKSKWNETMVHILTAVYSVM